MSVTLTDEQIGAIETSGRVIVSASAGSGKTFVMIERLISLIISGTDIRNVLCVTFTNKAAAQMREKLRTALLKKIAQASGEERQKFKTQLNALPLADISTIHAFCARLIRTHFYLIGLDPSFRIISPDDAEGKTLSSRAIAETFDSAYEDGGKEFADLLSVYYRKKKDARLRGIVLSLIGAVRGHAEYRTLLSQVGNTDNFYQACNCLYESYRKRLQFYIGGIEDRGALISERSKQAFEVCKDVIEACRNLISAKDLFEMVTFSQTPLAIRRMPPTTKATGEMYFALKYLSGASKAVKAVYAELQTYGDEHVERQRYQDGQCRARALAVLAQKYDEIYTRLKREANVLDYEDLEHFALELLGREEARREIAEKYQFMFVDEYQDVNPVQEQILSSIADRQIFLVGDAKQAIYGFRGSRSVYFKMKTQELEHALPLTKNFRSAPAILGCVNRVFQRVFGVLGEPYEPMRASERYGADTGSVHFHWTREEEEETSERGIYSVLSARRKQPDAVAEQIADLIADEYGTQWYDADETLADPVKSVTFGDIAVIVRKNDGIAERVVFALTERGIPVTSSSRINICDCFEIRLLIDWLSLLDNAEQDIPFASALLSSEERFTEEELSKIRLRFPSCNTFRAACREYETKMADRISEKLKSFHKRLELLRTSAQVLSAAEMLGCLLSQEGLEAFIAAKSGGRNRLSRVRRFLAEAERTGSVHQFLAVLKASDYRIEYSERAGDDAVKVLTMHASKGLEYPVVILAGLDGDFHDDHDELLWTDEFHAAPRSYDCAEKLIYETVLRRAAKCVQNERQIKDEANLLYVAMTRAKYRMHLLFEGGERALSPAFAKRFSDFFDFSDCARYFAEEAPRARISPARRSLGYRPDEERLQELKRIYCRKYGYEESTLLPVKSSATALIQRAEKTDCREFPVHTGKGFTADAGTAYHAFLEHVRFGGNAEKELDRMIAEGTIGPEQAALLDRNRLARILEIPCLKALSEKRVLREQTFLVNIPADEILDMSSRDEIVFQGAIDLLAEDEDGYTVIDYKYSSRSDEQIRADYAPQIKLYKKAVARICKVDEKTVRAKIVNIAFGREIEM